MKAVFIMSETPTFLSSSKDIENPDFTIVGLPYGADNSGRSGAESGPDAIREASALIETYSPYLNGDLGSYSIKDQGNLDLSGNFPLQYIQSEARTFFQADTFPVFLGGNHAVTAPLIKAAYSVFPDLHVLILDAHADLRDEYKGSQNNSVCTSRRIGDIIGLDRIKIFGVRSGTMEEFKLVHENDLRVGLFEEDLEKMVRFLEKKPVYLSLDLDVFDPSLMPGTGMPEPGGITYNVFLELCRRLRQITFVGFDVVELSPGLDTSGASPILAASCVRELMLLSKFNTPAKQNAQGE
ncbi:MAG: agmatinase [FCB group bacterium]|nr:agmatinase [FCB group bacterium]